MRLAIAGATGNIGRELLRVLEEDASGFGLKGAPILLASGASEDETMYYGDSEIAVKNLENFDFKNVDVMVFATPKKVSEVYVKKALENKIKAVDFSGAFRTDEGTPLVANGINLESITAETTLVSVADVATLAVAHVVKSLSEKVDVKQVVATTFYPSSYMGKDAMDALYGQSTGLLGGAGVDMEDDIFGHQVAFNVLPKVGAFVGANTEAEMNLMLEVNRVLKKPVFVASTAVTVPTFIGMSQTLSVTFNGALSADDARKAFETSDVLAVIDNPKEGEFSTPYGAAETSQIFVSRVRNDAFVQGTLHLWLTCDNLRTGAALQAAAILKALF